jgi:hypothetical protein
MRASARRSSMCVPTSRIRPRSGSTGMSGSNARPPAPGSPSPRCPTDSPPAMTQWPCTRSVPAAARHHRGVRPALAAPAPTAVWPGRSAGGVLVGDLDAPGEFSRTIVFDAPRRARGFFEAPVADNLDIGRPHNVDIIFGRRIRRDTWGPSAPPSTAATTAASSSTSSTSTRGSSNTSKTGRRCGSRPLSTPTRDLGSTPSTRSINRYLPESR